MKNYKIHILILFAVGYLLTSCQYDEVVSTDYPPQEIYIPIAGNIYSINEVTTSVTGHPTEGNTFRFTVDNANNQFNIPLGVYRSGINNNGTINVKVEADTDTISKLIAKGELDAETLVLPSGTYELSSSAEIRSGKSLGNFNLTVDLNFLKENAPEKKYALGVSVSSTDCKMNESLKTAVILIDTKIMIPTANFAFSVDANQWNKVKFVNTSSYGMSYEWNFGDGNTSTDTTPTHVFAEKGIYTVTLKATGVNGEVVTKSIELPVLEIKKINKSQWKIHDFSTDEPEEGGQASPLGYISAVIDNDISTFWHSRWTQEVPYPHWFEVDMGQEWTITSFVCFRRQGDGRGQTECKFFTSLDGENWDEQGTFDVNSGDDAGQTFTMSAYPRARYFRYEATKGNSWFAFLAEIDAYGAE